MNHNSKAFSVIGENLDLLSEDSASASERRLVQLKELALQLVRDTSVIFGENKTRDFSSLFESTEIPDSITDESKDYLELTKNNQSYTDKLTVCTYLNNELERLGISPINKLLQSKQHPSTVKIAYFRNAYADAAFRTFSEMFESPSVSYASDFTAVCEEVYYGRADMCMLPLDSSRDAKLISFYRLIDKYELNPIYSCDVTTPDGSVTTRYALLQRGMSVPSYTYLDTPNSCFFEFNLILDESTAFFDVLQAARAFDLTLYKVDSIPLTYSDSEFACDIIFKVGNARGLNAFVLYLNLAVPQYEPLGIYPHIRTED